MFVARDQENLIHAQQTAAISKPLNQGSRQLQPKTPANKGLKTPFKAPLNDENNILTFGAGKQGLTARRNQNENGGKSGFGDKRPLVTPMGPRNRAPLGMKTTNAKANMFQTPSHPLGTLKQARSGRRASTVRKKKTSVQTTQAEQHKPEAVEEDEREIEYMPPKPKPLPDHDDYITYNTTFPQFKGRNFARGWNRIYEDNEVGKDGLTRKERESKEQEAAHDKRMDDLIQQQIDNMDLLGINVRESPDEPSVEEVVQEQKKKKSGKMDVHRSASTLQSRNAAEALAQPPKPAAPDRTKVRATSRTGLISSLAPQRKTPVPSNPSSMRHTAAVASSKTTVGYSKGRGMSSTLRSRTPRQQADRPSSMNSIISPERYMELYGPPPFGSEMWSRCNAAGYFDPDFSETTELQEEAPPVYEEDEEIANFELTL